MRSLTMRLTFCAGLSLVAGLAFAADDPAASSAFHFPATGVRVDGRRP